VSIEREVTEDDTSVVFDGQCPFCRVYAASLEGENGINNTGVTKIDARCAPELVAQLAHKGIDINTGIVLIKGETIYQDSAALTLLAQQHGASGVLATLHHRLLRYRFLSLAIYPLLRALRNIYLRLVGQAAIETGIVKD